jgi:uncharacterized membrane protein YheB (UPF0754 family)
MRISKGLVVNLIALLLVVASFFVPEDFSKYLYFSGLFALSGAITNQIAIYMIFNRVPFLYGSGVVELNFEKFKNSIKNMIMEQFFSQERIDKFLKAELESIDFAEIIEEIDFTPAYESLKESIIESKFGQVLNLFGGESALESLKVTFIKKLKSSIISITSSKAFKEQLKNLKSISHSRTFTQKIDTIISEKLDTLTPKDVKSLVEKLIKEHLDWLVVWGGIFGGLIGLVSTIILN